MQTGWAIAGLGTSGGAILALWRAWRCERGKGLPRTIALVLAAASAACWRSGFGSEIGIPLLMESWALLGFGFILTRMERKPERAGRQRAVSAPPTPPLRWGRGLLQALIGGPLALVAAIGIAALIATHAPLHEQTRLVGAGLLVPSLWAVLLGWTLSAERLYRPVAGVVLLGGAGLGLSLGLAG